VTNRIEISINSGPCGRFLFENMRYALFTFSFILLVSLRAYSQGKLTEAEIQIQQLHKQISPERSTIENQNLADSITDLLENALQIPEAIKYPFDSLKFLGKIRSDDTKLRLLSWNLPQSGGTNRYFGFIMFRPSNGETKVFRLIDTSHALTGAEFTEQTADSWYGCLVYDIIDIQYSGDTWYTLLGYDPDNLFTTKKQVDILWFRDDKPVFGKPVFRYKKQLQYRILFEYSARVQMTLTWNPRLDMIVFDHLAPSLPAYQGNFRYYGPDFSYDGLKFEKGNWELHENIDVHSQ